ncbi:MAG: cation diffusion facilitator family transporter, partial [Cyanobacteria bacterium P01_G01_bin.49]
MTRPDLLSRSIASQNSSEDGIVHSPKVSLYAAMIANIAIGIAKFTGATITGSSAMLSEGIHSVVDSANEILLLYGLKKSQSEPDEQHPLGYGQELYFWSLIVAILIFALGGGVSIYEGIESIKNPEYADHNLISYAVLGVSAIFESIALLVSVREFNKNYPSQPKEFWNNIRTSKDPSSFIVIFEDFAALIGLTVAFLGILISEIKGNPIYDSIASITIGLILTVVAIVLVIQTKRLLIGESASLETRQSIRMIVQSDQAVSKMESPITFHLGPKD